MLQAKRRCGLLFLSAMLLIGGLAGFLLVRNVAASPNHRPPAAPHGGESFQSASDCLQADQKATLSYAGNAWQVELVLTIQDVSLVPDDRFDVIWYSKADSQGEEIAKNILSERLPPIKVKFVFDIDQAALYSGPLLTADQGEENRRREKDFWKELLTGLVSPFSFTGKGLTDMGIVYEGRDINPICNTDMCTFYENSIFNALLDAVQQSYLIGSPVGDVGAIMAKNEWPKRDGEKVMVIVRWRAEPLTFDSYPPLRETLFKDRTFLLVIGRTSDLPEGWQKLKDDFDKRYGIQIEYIPAPPAYFPTSGVIIDRLRYVFDKLHGNVHKNRQRLKLRFEFPFLLDRSTVDQGRLKVRHPANGCSSDEIALSWTRTHESPPRLPLAITWGAPVTASLGVTQVLFLTAIVVYKISSRFRERIDGLRQSSDSRKEVGR